LFYTLCKGVREEGGRGVRKEDERRVGETERERRKGERTLMETAYCLKLWMFSTVCCWHGDIPPAVLRQ